MTDWKATMSITLREWRGPLLIWALLTAVAALTGPFETYQVLSAAPRTLYWAGIVGLSVAFDAGFRRLLRDRPLAWHLLARLPFALLLAGMVHLVNHLVFSGWQGWGGYLFLAGVVLAITAVFEIAARALAWQGPALPGAVPSGPVPAAPDPAETFLRRLPLDKRGALIRLEAQDHYLNVVTGAGAALILMRMADAEAELTGVPGLRVHRSHWVAQDAVRRHLRRTGRDFLEMADGAEVPVSRSYRPAAVAAGLI